MVGTSPSFRGAEPSSRRSLAGDGSRRTSRVRVVNLSPQKAPGPQELAEYGKAKGFVGVNVDRTYEKLPLDPSLFKIHVQRKHLDHLMNDDLDEISKFEVVYKILKD